MAHATVSLQPPNSVPQTQKIRRAVTAIAWAGIVAIAVGFVLKYVFHYYLNYNPTAYNPYWPRRVGLLLHITGGMTALLTAPWQFFTGLRNKSMNVHRWTGRVFLGGIAAGATGALYLAFTTTFGWAFGFGLVMLAVAWLTTTGMAWYAIRNGLKQVHKEWMMRAYIVTFGFVTFRVFNDYGPTSHLKPENDLAITLSWACWVVPLGIAEVILQLSKMRKQLRRA